MAAGSGCWWWSTIARANASRPPRTPRSPARGWPANSTRSSPGAGRPSGSSATTAPVRGYKWAKPGDLIDLDMKKLARFEEARSSRYQHAPQFVHVCIEDHASSRMWTS